ncbi:outer membrane protein assembly factor BamB family protein [Vreelandella sp. GE22]
MIDNSVTSQVSFLVVGLLASLPLISSPALANSTMFQANLERTGVYDDTGPESSPKLAWKFDTGSPVFSTPLVYDGLVYFADFEGGVYAVNQNSGSLIWEKSLEQQPSFQITVNENFLLVGRRFSRNDNESYLIALDRLSGEEIWRFEPDDKTGMDAATIYNDMVFLTSMSNNLFSLDLATGEEIWRHPIQGGSGQPLISNDMLFFQDTSQSIDALSVATGEIIWSYFSSINKQNSFSTPAIDSCCIYSIVSENEGGVINQINKNNGELIAEFPIEFSTMSSISLDNDIAFFGDDGEGYAGAHGYMNAMNVENGELIWRFETEGFIRGAASIAGDTVYFGSGDHYMYAVDRHTGEMKWRYETDAGISSAPAIVDGRLYFGSIDGYVYVLE